MNGHIQGLQRARRMLASAVKGSKGMGPGARNRPVQRPSPPAGLVGPNLEVPLNKDGPGARGGQHSFELLPPACMLPSGSGEALGHGGASQARLGVRVTWHGLASRCTNSSGQGSLPLRTRPPAGGKLANFADATITSEF